MPRGRKAGSKNATKVTVGIDMQKVAMIVLEYKNIVDAQEVLNKRYLNHQQILNTLTPSEFKLYFEGSV